MTILLADDEMHITSIMARKLEGAGFDVRVARDGEEALALATSCRPGLVVTDLQMPYMSGIELATRLREHEATRDTPVILLTARGFLVSDAEIARTNIRVTKSKPFSATDLLGEIQALLGTPARREAA